MTLEELRAQYPDQVAQLEAEALARASATPPAAAGTTPTPAAAPDAVASADAASAVQAERERMQAIDAIAGVIDPAMVKEAKYGSTACSAEVLALRAVKAAAQSGQSFLTNMMKDFESSNSAQVSATPGENPNAQKKDVKDMTPEERLEDARAQVKAIFHGKDGK